MRDNDAPLLLDVSRMLWRRWAGTRPTGIDRICLAWLQHYGSRAQATIVHRRGWHLLPVPASQTLFALLAAESGRSYFRRRLAAWALRHAALLAGALPGRGLAGLGRPWLNVGHTGLDLPQLPTWVRQAGVRPVLMLHDIIPITHPQFCRAGEAERHAVRVKTLLAIAHGIIGNSHDTLHILAAHARRIGMAVPPCAAIWPGTPQLARPPGAGRLAQLAEFVILGTIEGRKNHTLLLDVWDRLGPAAPKLVIIGRRGWASEGVFARLDSGRYGACVEETGPLDDAAIARRLAGATALLFPSFAEGYGLPLVEALAAGVPVIASDLAVFREIGQGVPHLLPPGDVAGWADAIMAHAAPGSPVRAAQMARLAGFRAPDWDTHFAQVDAFLAGLTPSGWTAPVPRR